MDWGVACRGAGQASAPASTKTGPSSRWWYAGRALQSRQSTLVLLSLALAAMTRSAPARDRFPSVQITHQWATLSQHGASYEEGCDAAQAARSIGFL